MPMFATAKTMAAAAAAGLSMLAVAACSSGGASSGGGTTYNITVGTSGATGVYAPLYVGVQTGLFKKYGLNVTLQTLTPTSVSAATIAGNIDVGWDGPNLVAGIVANPSAKVIFTAGPTVFYIYGKGVSSLQQLRGKSVAVTTPGGAIDTATRAALQKAGLKPGSDVKITYLQTNSAALAAAENGTVDAAGVSPPTSIQAAQAGLTDLADITGDSPPSVLAVNDNYAAGNRKAVQKFITAFKAAVKLTAGNEGDFAAAMKTYVKLTSQSQITGTYTAYKSVWKVAPFPTAQMTMMLQQLAHGSPPVKAAATTKVSSLIDNSYLNAAG